MGKHNPRSGKGPSGSAPPAKSSSSKVKKFHQSGASVANKFVFRNTADLPWHLAKEKLRAAFQEQNALKLVELSTNPQPPLTKIKPLPPDPVVGPIVCPPAGGIRGPTSAVDATEVDFLLGVNFNLEMFGILPNMNPPEQNPRTTYEAPVTINLGSQVVQVYESNPWTEYHDRIPVNPDYPVWLATRTTINDINLKCQRIAADGNKTILQRTQELNEYIETSVRNFNEKTIIEVKKFFYLDKKDHQLEDEKLNKVVNHLFPSSITT